MKYTTAVFDLDGTITDSCQGIINAIRYALERWNIQEPPEDVLRSFIGPPLQQQFQRVFHLSEEDGAAIVSTYRVYYGEKGIFENQVYEGVPQMLERLKTEGVKMLMATSKPEKYARQIAQHFGFDKYFDYIGGACMDGTRTVKHEVIEYVLEICGIPEADRKNTVMIGDRHHDIEGAKQSGLHSLGVLYGYGSREELEKAGAEEIAETPGEVAKLVLNTVR